MQLGIDYQGLKPLEPALIPAGTELADGVTVYKVDATNNFTMQFPVDKSSRGTVIEVVAEGIDNTGTIRLWQNQQGVAVHSVVTNWNVLLDEPGGSQASLTVTAGALIATFNNVDAALKSGFIGLDFAFGSITTGTVYVIVGRGG